MLVDSLKEEEEMEGGAAWLKMVKDLRLLAFDMDNDDGWAMLGVSKLEGPEPDKNTIFKRAGLINDILDTTPDAALEPQEQATRARWVCRVQVVKLQCAGELREVIKTRKQMEIMKDRLPRWAEAAPTVVEHVMREVGKPSICALNMSNLLRSGEMRADGAQVRNTNGRKGVGERAGERRPGHS